jgi:signal transduction histidine kinase
MKNSLLVILTGASLALLSIIAVTGVVAVRGANQINQEIATISAVFHQTERSLNRLRSDLDTARVSVRDYIIDPVSESPELKLSEFSQLRTSINNRLYDLAQLLGPDQAAAVKDLRIGIDGYFDSLAPILEEGRRGFPGGTVALRNELTSHRIVAAAVAKRIEEINEQSFLKRNAEVEEARSSLSTYLVRMIAVAIVLGLAVTSLSSYRIMVLQQRDRRHQLEMKQTESELRQLSGKLVRAQEDERKSISRELHDEVGQTLTALGIEIGNIEKLRASPEFDEHIADAKYLAQRSLKTVRNLAMGLRPSMLDDSGLVPALRWEIREFAKRTGVPVDLQIDGSLDRLSDNVGTCVYRVVQESLTNCARHANAHNIRISLRGDQTLISLAIQDDGVGFDPSSTSSGIGIIGIEERVRELGGGLKITSGHRKGTLLLIEIPTEATAS